jgi:predicted RNA-binding Zn-ribbon protein involved in translation (DUF1610 family)
LPAEIYSRPKYARLAPDLLASSSLLVAEGGGIAAVVDLLKSAPEEFAARATILYLPASPGRYELDTEFPASVVRQFASRAELLSGLRETLHAAAMGLRLYLAGSEEWIGQIKSIAYEFGMSDASICAEHRGSATRRVQCVHCKQILEGVARNLVPCAGCGAVLYVRDHYSRRLAAFMGVAMNAEDTQAPLPAAENFS